MTHEKNATPQDNTNGGEVECVACEDNPSGENNPCAVCGRAALAHQPLSVPAGWQTMDTAPKDGSQFQAWIDKYGWEPNCRINPETEAFEIFGRVDYDADGYEVYPHMIPTHWQPLPAAPKNVGGEEE